MASNSDEFRHVLLTKIVAGGSVGTMSDASPASTATTTSTGPQNLGDFRAQLESLGDTLPTASTAETAENQGQPSQPPKPPAADVKPGQQAQAAKGIDPEVEWNGKKLPWSHVQSQIKELERGARTKFDEAAAMRQQVQAYVQSQVKQQVEQWQRQYQQSPEFEQAATDALSRKMNLASMGKAEREAFEARQQADAYKQQLEQIQAHNEQVRSQYEQQQWGKWYSDNIAAAMQEIGVPADAQIVGLIADRIAAYGMNGHDPTNPQTVKRAVADVNGFIDGVANGRVKHLSANAAEKLLELLDDAGRDKLREAMLKQAKLKPKTQQAPPAQAPRPKGDDKWIGLSDFRKELEALQ